MSSKRNCSLRLGSNVQDVDHYDIYMDYKFAILKWFETCMFSVLSIGVRYQQHVNVVVVLVFIGIHGSLKKSYLLSSVDRNSTLSKILQDVGKAQHNHMHNFSIFFMIIHSYIIFHLSSV